MGGVTLTPETPPFLSETRTQAGHTLTVPQAVRLLNGDYVTALADAATTLAIGIVSAVDGDKLTVAFSGRIAVTAHGFAINALLFVSPTAAGGLTPTQPTAAGHFQNPIARVYDADTLLVLPWRFEQLPEISNRVVATSATPASLSSTEHAVQIGANGAERTVISPNSIFALTAGGAASNFFMDAISIFVRLVGFMSFRTPDTIPLRLESTAAVTLAADFTQLQRYSSNSGAVVQGETGFDGPDGYSIDNRKTGTNNKNTNFLFAVTSAAARSQRFIATSASAASISSTLHAFQVGADGAQRSAYSPNRITAVTAVGGRDTFLLDATVLQTESLEQNSTIRAMIVPRVANVGTIVNTQNGAIFYDTGSNVFRFRENGVWVTGSGLA